MLAMRGTKRLCALLHRAQVGPRALLRAALSSETHWPDGTAKRFRGKDAWKNWINYDAPFKSQTDELNRMRHFFWEVDGKGALWRLELDQPGSRFGQMKHKQILNQFFGSVQPNTTGLYDEFPFVSLRSHEHYFVRWATSSTIILRSVLEVPIVFNDLREGELRHIMPGSGDIAISISTPFVPSKLRLTPDGRLLHAVSLSRQVAAAGDRTFFAAVDCTTTQQILCHCVEVDEGILLRWDGSDLLIAMLEEGFQR